MFRSVDNEAMGLTMASSDDRKRTDSGSKKDKSHKSKKSEKSKSKKDTEAVSKAKAVGFSLLASQSSLDPTLSSLFAAQPTPPTRNQRLPVAAAASEDDVSEDDETNLLAEEEAASTNLEDIVATEPVAEDSEVTRTQNRRKRKRKENGDDIEDVYMRKLAREEDRAARAKASAVEDDSKRRTNSVEDDDDDKDDASLSGEANEVEEADVDMAEDEHLDSPPPKHETEEAAELEFDKVNRTIFLGNVSTTAIASKTSHKLLLDHLRSFFDKVKAPAEGAPKHSIESMRFRSTPYATSAPKKAAYAKKELMDATTKSTNAYVVYSSQLLAREAAKRLNGSMVLDRHLRVDEVAHPAKVDSRRCVFVGNLGFVDDESAAAQAEEDAEDKPRRKPRKQPSDVEEGLWRTFAKCGTVESVRVIRDSKTRVSKGVAYVQFDDENAVESALLYNGKKFPPMLPRTLRVTRARAAKRNAEPGSGRPSARPKTNGYQRKITNAEASQMGRANKLFGRAGAAEMRKNGQVVPLPKHMKAPEAFVFEGHRATSGNGGRSAIRKRSSKGKPTSRSARRGAAYKKAKTAK